MVWNLQLVSVPRGITVARFDSIPKISTSHTQIFFSQSVDKPSPDHMIKLATKSTIFILKQYYSIKQMAFHILNSSIHIL